MRNTIMALVLSGFLAIPAHAGHTPDGIGHDVAINVNGLVCDFCAQSIKTLFGKQAGVSAVHVDLDHGLVTLDLDDGASLNDDVITKIMTDSGYTVTGIRHM